MDNLNDKIPQFKDIEYSMLPSRTCKQFNDNMKIMFDNNMELHQKLQKDITELKLIILEMKSIILSNK